MSATMTPRRPANRRRLARPLPVLLMRLVAISLAVFATLHLAGALHVGSSSKPSYGAGVAEALIGVVLLGGSLARSRPAALSVVGFSIFGFLVGLTFTVGGGSLIDLAYHLMMLPVLIATALLLAVAEHGPPRVQNTQKST
jgi:peptidoglycan/LPS O-acetylase OafA/YrhL